MHFSKISALFMASMVYAMPSAMPDDEDTVAVHGPSGLTNVTVGRRDISFGPLDKRDPDAHCQGSSRCDNKQSLKEGCGVAYGRIANTIYNSNGGSGSGVCDGHCAIFVKGHNCQVTGTDLTLAYQKLQQGGCQTCGWTPAVSVGADPAKAGGDCNIKVDYTGNCA